MTDHPEIEPGQSIELLKELHILTRDGRLNQDSRRKLKQVRHLCQFVEPILAESRAGNPALSVIDHGAGKSYFGFMLYDRFLKDRTDASRVFCIERRDDLVERSRQLAERLGFDRMSFLNLSVEQSMHADAIPKTVDVVTALHACDTATDDAIRFAIGRQARFIVLVPCCQAELAGVLRKNKSIALRDPLTELWRHPVHTREFGSQATNVLRCLQLEAHGYQVNVTELVGWEHSMKNELIIASHRRLPGHRAAERLGQVLHALGIDEMRDRFFTPT